MDRDEISFLAHADHPVASPFDDDTVDDLLTRLTLPPGGTAIDIGCGRGEWLFRLLAREETGHGVGIDRSAPAIEAARARAAALGMSERVTLIHADADRHLQAHPVLADVALCVGASSALGGLQPTLARLRRMLRPRGYALLGEVFWQRPPTPAALAALQAEPDDLTDLSGLVDAVCAEGFTPLYVLCSSEREWDRYEWSWCGALERHAPTLPERGDRDEARRVVQRHRDAYVRGYRGVMGFAGMVLR